MSKQTDRIIPVVTRWQQGERLTSAEQADLHAFTVNVTHSAWYNHFRKSTTHTHFNWELRDALPLAFLEYLKYPRSVRLAGQRACTLHERFYPSAVQAMVVFRLQFPRILTVLTANQLGITLLKSYEPRITPYMVELIIYRDMHKALVTYRNIMNERNLRAVDLLTPEITTEVMLTLGPLYPKINSRSTPQVRARRALAVNAAADTLVKLSHTLSKPYYIQ
jgi:hypothetical protein